jgi:hypothetical protein
MSTYDIFYYDDRAMTKRQTGFDANVPYRRTPAVEGAEVAWAQSKVLGCEDMYGYDGEWHDQPPREAQDALAKAAGL